MSPLETGECVHTLVELFPESKMTEAEIDLFRAELFKFDRDCMNDSIRAHRLFTRYNRPDFKAIFGECRERERSLPNARRQQSTYRSGLARSIVATHPNLNGRPEAELILRNYRYFLRFKHRNPETNEVDFYPDEALPLDRLPGLCAACVTDLISAGWEVKNAEQAATWINIDLASFNVWCRDLSTNRVEEECPI